MPNDEKAAKRFLKGLDVSAPWNTPLSGYPARKPEPKPATPPRPKPARTTGDDAGDQAEVLAARNRDLAKRTRHLRKDY